MTSRLQEPCNAAGKPSRDFVVFRRVRVHSDAGADFSCNDGRLPREVMRQSEEQGLDGVEPGVQLAGFLHLRRSRVVRCEVSFDDTGSNDTQVLVPSLAHACVTGVTGDR